MSLGIIVPIKSIFQGKSRLQNVLTRFQRASLNFLLLQRTLDLLTQHFEKRQLVVISNCPITLNYAQTFAISPLLECAPQGLCPALTQATQYLRASGANRILIISNDLPTLTMADIEKVLDTGKSQDSLVIATDRKKIGTNTLYLHSQKNISYYFGFNNSLNLHINEGHHHHLKTFVLQREGLAFDLDLLADYREFASHL